MNNKTKFPLLLFCVVTLGAVGFIVNEKRQNTVAFDERGVVVSAVVVGHTHYTRTYEERPAYFVSVEFTPVGAAQSVEASIHVSKAQQALYRSGQAVQVVYKTPGDGVFDLRTAEYDVRFVQ